MLIVCLVLGTKEAVVNKNVPALMKLSFFWRETEKEEEGGKMKEEGRGAGRGNGRKLDSCK